MRIRTLLVPFLALLPVLVLQSAASGQGYVAPSGSLVLSASEARPGGTVTVSGAGCLPNSTVSIAFQPGGVPLGTAQAGANGAFAATVTVPADATAGTHTITTTCTGANGQPRVLSSTVTVLGTDLSRGGPLGTDLSTGGPLPRTGSSNVVPQSLAGVALIGVGGVAVVAGRRRRAVA